MANSEYFMPGTPSLTRVTPQRTSSCQKSEVLDEREVVQGKILWLPMKDELPEKAVRRAHGKGAVEEGVYNHPVVIVSRPKDDPRVVHFHVITSFQGKKLHELYPKANEFHASRRSWYLPITPTPAHPDANSKKAKKRFPTLELANGALLRWDSYVNLRDVYRTNLNNLRTYGNPDTPVNGDYRFHQESMIRLLAKSRFLTGYEAEDQLQTTQPSYKPDAQTPYKSENRGRRSEVWEEGPQPRELSRRETMPEKKTTEPYSWPSVHEVDFLGPKQSLLGDTPRPPREPPDTGGKKNMSSVLRSWLLYILQLVSKFAKRVWSDGRK